MHFPDEHPSVFVLGVDRDPSAIDDFKSSRKGYKYLDSRLRLLNEKFSNLTRVPLIPFIKAKGVLFDLGYSTAQVIRIIEIDNA